MSRAVSKSKFWSMHFQQNHKYKYVSSSYTTARNGFFHRCTFLLTETVVSDAPRSGPVNNMNIPLLSLVPCVLHPHRRVTANSLLSLTRGLYENTATLTCMCTPVYSQRVSLSEQFAALCAPVRLGARMQVSVSPQTGRPLEALAARRTPIGAYFRMGTSVAVETASIDKLTRTTRA